MHDRGMQVKVGLLVLVSAVLFVAFIIILGDFSAKPGITVFALFDTSADLKVGAPVKIAGVTAGKVKDVSIREETTTDNVRRVAILVKLDVEVDKAKFIRSDAEAYITTLGLLGEKYIEIDPGDNAAQLVADGGHIRGNSPVRLEILMANIARVLDDVAAVLERNRTVIDSTLLAFNDTAIHLNLLVYRLGPQLQELATKVTYLIDRGIPLVGNLEELANIGVNTVGDGSEIKRIVGNVEKITAQLNSRVNPTMNRVDDVLIGVQQLADQYRQIGAENREKVLTTIEKLESVITMAEDITRFVRQGKGAVGALLGDQDLYDDFKELIEDIKRHPWKIIWKE
ncbi:MAG: MCE family protein [Myxococcales bacterium]|nr:MCE family protein [Myxococcales bacterium]